MLLLAAGKCADKWALRKQSGDSWLGGGKGSTPVLIPLEPHKAQDWRLQGTGVRKNTVPGGGRNWGEEESPPVLQPHPFINTSDQVPTLQETTTTTTNPTRERHP